ncbi:MAG: N-acetylmuramoyl-L-alanine amidase [Candidatus Marinimicrobia bacterium]|jgi:N-acetylmuramoyl-L-alanine amidase|nr:N-acetylmuramoyl-L-alanine amidase [Candidatus Neomarinimicrobiota bacterium]MBT3631057.1 N-acetylmuramoyl-L-alanine amidase [Candidatus Neomarinimicrobiota bacterium]MBT3825697.1 N-acetylmuramoyl-L-alanine amidase [Candidatus Neomarinimicrobiota bacterium]MBT4130559.1 N-acetylmuramoyl-L-alanine amidase [Candidatus Neomarinimicrobiota bacterium]MBT4296220.1 N-acetylmuramoyl-L-alanine amidase [Candidatus Neomarinimicrobiota bacterium]
MSQKLVLTTLVILVLSACTGTESMLVEEGPLAGINITIDPGHGDTQAYDSFRIGQTGEREEWINLRVAKLLSQKLSRAGANVLMTRGKDRDVSLGGRAALARLHQSDLFVSIHHNGSVNDLGMDFPLVYFFGAASLNPASVDFAKILLDSMRAEMTFNQQQAGAAYSDHLIYSSGTSVLRNTVDDMPGVIGEGGFFTHPAGEGRLKSKEYNKLEAEIYYKAILDYFERGTPSATPLIPDSLKFIDLGKPIEFELDDGFGNTFFEENSFMVLQDDEKIQSSWDSNSGILTAVPDSSQEKRVTFQVFARNLKGNAMHPVPFKFLTEFGYDWYSHGKWFEAFNEAEVVYTQIASPDIETSENQLVLIDASLHLYQLSLELQIVHPQARLAEEKILWLLEKKQDLLEVDLSEELEAQKGRLKDYYPE